MVFGLFAATSLLRLSGWFHNHLFVIYLTLNGNIENVNLLRLQDLGQALSLLRRSLVTLWK